jgi:iron uptake system EfeUOB component EfeO/EfeM
LHTSSTRTTLVLLGVVALAATGCGAGARHSSGTSTASSGTPVVSINVDRHGCAASTTRLKAGPTTFLVHVQNGNSVTEVELVKQPIVLVEIENLATTREDRNFSLVLQPGNVTLQCPGGERVRTVLSVTGRPPAPANPASAAAVERYRTWIEGQSRQLVDATLSFTQALDHGNVTQARERYPRARIFYERVEPIAESFSTLDKEIDARAGDVPAAQWTGFHPIERSLWVEGSTTGTAVLSRKLVADVSAVNSVATRLTLTPAQIANGAVTLLDEVASSKITGEEERYSHTDLVDFAANLDGSEAAFEAVRPLMPASQAQLARTIQLRFADVHQALDRYRSGSGFVRYSALGRTDTRRLSQVVDALAEPLSQVSAIVLRAS